GVVAFASKIPHVFFSIRTWRSGKGWFAIICHSILNFILLTSINLGNQNQWLTNNPILDSGLIMSSAIVIAIMYPIYKWRIRREAKKNTPKNLSPILPQKKHGYRNFVIGGLILACGLTLFIASVLLPLTFDKMSSNSLNKGYLGDYFVLLITGFLVIIAGIIILIVGSIALIINRLMKSRTKHSPFT
ncbi:MAG: hypothetical protein ACRD9Q_10545, partial [Nitrososphaeraceae archaeon]